jgi:formate-dependent phosphoribosylglycinamide formyltransferase (GAR transformylase)
LASAPLFSASDPVSKVALIDTNRAAIPIYEALVGQGHDVWVVGADPQEPLAKISRNYRKLDYSDVPALAEFVASENFDFIVPGCTDVSYAASAQVSGGRFPGIDAPDKVKLINDKSEFRKLASKLDIPGPRALSVEQALGWDAVVVKPVDSFSGRGMTVLHKPRQGDLTAALETARTNSPTGAALIEEFISGQLYSHSAFVCRNQVVADFIVREDCVVNSFAVDTSCVQFDFSRSLLQRLRADALTLTSQLGLADGLLHSQFMVKDDRYWFIETTRRCPGDLYALLIEMSTGYPYTTSYAAPFLGGMQVDRGAALGRENIIRHTATAQPGESIWGIGFRRAIELRCYVPLAVAGAQGPGRVALLFLAAQSESERDSLYQSLLEGKLYGWNPH